MIKLHPEENSEEAIWRITDDTESPASFVRRPTSLFDAVVLDARLGSHSWLCGRSVGGNRASHRSLRGAKKDGPNGRRQPGTVGSGLVFPSRSRIVMV